jgi:pyridoxal phosphate enzyme (YggS family)
VGLVAVTKMMDPERIREAYDAGARVFGENYVQETLTKVDRLPRDIEWHMIGHLQSNKAKRGVEIYSTVESLDRPSLAAALEKAARARGVRLPVLVQVNVGGESSKSGATPAEAVQLVQRAGEWPSLCFQGLMAIPPYLAEPERVRPYFRALRELRERVVALVPDVEMTELSMGMSHDFGVAIEEGATLVRVGTAIFGERDG